MSTTAMLPLPEGLPTVSASAPIADRNGYVYADDTLAVGITRRFPDGEPIAYVTALDTEPREGDESPEGFAELLLPLSALQAFADGLPAILEALRALGARS